MKLILLAALITNFVWAGQYPDVCGHWLGTGSSTVTDGHSSQTDKCSDIYYELNCIDGTFFMTGTGSVCNGDTIPPLTPTIYTFRIVRQNLSLDDKKVGTLTNNAIHLAFTASGLMPVTYSFTLDTNGELHFSQKLVLDGEITVQGILQRVRD